MKNAILYGGLSLILLVCVVALFWLKFVDRYGIHTEKRITITEKQWDSELSNSFAEGYKCGKIDGFRQGIESQCTPNDIRRAFFFEPIESESETDEQCHHDA